MKFVAELKKNTRNDIGNMKPTSQAKTHCGKAPCKCGPFADFLGNAISYNVI